MSLSKQDEARIEAAIRGCERTTGGQIVCVLADSAMVRRTALPVLLAALVALAVPWLLMALTQLPVQTVLLLQLLAFVVLLALGSLPAIERALTPPAVRRALAWRLAAEQFVVRGVSRTPDRSGILIFVARAERYARIIADEGIARHVPTSQWRAAVDALVAHMRDDRPADGFIAAIAICTETLRTYRPQAAAGANTLPDRVYQI
jgi:putative membrane protein